MAYNLRVLAEIFEKTDGHCHICNGKLEFEDYGKTDAPGAWEVDHHEPLAKGGTDHLDNLFPACSTCNRSKQDSSTETARRKL